MYTPLVPRNPLIRLLTLQPGQFDEDILCSLHIAPLEEGSRYEALSYLWGDANITLPIVVDDRVVQVTTNLQAALRHLRWREKTRILWVDAICINQQDIEERNVQVPLMGDIYRCATSVISWLGHGDEHVTKAITWTQYHILHQTSEATLEWSEMENTAPVDEDRQYIKFSCLQSALSGCLNLLQHEYWSRMWTFQEFVLPRESPICVYGHFTFSMLGIIEAVRTLHECLDKCRWAGNATFRKKTQNLWDLAQQEFLQRSENMAANVSQERIIRREALMQFIIDSGPGALDYLLMITADRKSSDPRDKIYALYAFIPALSKKFPPDYSKTEKQVLTEAISHEVDNGHCRWLWMIFRLRSDRFFSTTFPSWCPDFYRPHRNFRLTNARKALDSSTSSAVYDRFSSRRSRSRYPEVTRPNRYSRLTESRRALKFSTSPAIYDGLSSTLFRSGYPDFDRPNQYSRLTGTYEALDFSSSPAIYDGLSSTLFRSGYPDFDRPNRYSRPTEAREALDFSSSSVTHDKISADLTTLHLWSWNLGVCKVLGRIDLESDEGPEETYLSVHAARAFWAFLSGLKTHGSASAQALQRKFIRFAVSKFMDHDQVSDEELLEALEATSNGKTEFAMEYGTHAFKAMSLVTRLGGSFHFRSEGVACVVTSHGCVAFAPMDTEDNDLMVSPRDPTPPMVLRKEHNWRRHADQEFYLMVGPADVNIAGKMGHHEVDAVSKIRGLGVAEYLIH